MEDLCLLSKKDCLKTRVTPSGEPRKDWNFTGQVVSFWKFTYRHNIVTNFCAEKGTTHCIKLEHSGSAWLLFVLVNPAYIKSNFHIKW